MCGFIYNVNDFPLLEPLLDFAGYDENDIREIIKNQYLRPTDTVINLVPSRTGPRLLGATWWLATLPDGRPNPKYSTFNSKAEKITSSPLHTRLPRSIRTVIPVSGFCEWQPIFKGDRLYTELPGTQGTNKLPPVVRKQQCLIERSDKSLMLLASVSKLRIDKTGKPLVNTSVITLPPHQDFLDIHHKSFPLVLDSHELERWLDPKADWSEFSHLLTMDSFRHQFKVTEVGDKCEPLNDKIRLFPEQTP